MAGIYWTIKLTSGNGQSFSGIRSDSVPTICWSTSVLVCRHCWISSMRRSSMLELLRSPPTMRCCALLRSGMIAGRTASIWKSRRLSSLIRVPGMGRELEGLNTTLKSGWHFTKAIRFISLSSFQNRHRDRPSRMFITPCGGLSRRWRGCIVESRPPSSTEIARRAGRPLSWQRIVKGLSVQQS